MQLRLSPAQKQTITLAPLTSVKSDLYCVFGLSLPPPSLPLCSTTGSTVSSSISLDPETPSSYHGSVAAPNHRIRTLWEQTDEDRTETPCRRQSHRRRRMDHIFFSQLAENSYVTRGKT
jgi:hypothetical protein